MQSILRLFLFAFFVKLSQSNAPSFNASYLRQQLRPLPINFKKPNMYDIGVIVWWAELPDLASCANLAFNDINNRTDILPTHNLNPIFKDSGGNSKSTLPRAMELVGNDWRGVTKDPIVNSSVVLGPLRSAASILANHIYELKRVPGISATSTSVELGDTQAFPFFSRVIGSDAQQGTAMARFCHEKGWNKIAILFTSDSYSSSITTEFLKAGRTLVPPVEAVVATSFISGSNKLNISLATQANLIKASKSRVIYAPLVPGDLKFALSEFHKHGLRDAPYIWLGADGWFDMKAAPIGSFMSAPYTPPVNGSNEQVNKFDSLWKQAVAEKLTTNLTTYSVFCAYQYDAVHLIARALEGLESNLTTCNNAVNGTNLYNSSLCRTNRQLGSGGVLNHLMRNVPFQGATGEVKLDKNGERVTVWGFLNKNPTSTKPDQSQLVGRVDLGTGAFVKSGQSYYPGEGYSQTPPRSFPEEVTVQETINLGFFYFVIVVSLIVIILSLAAMVLAVHYREKPIMRLSSYRINNVTTMGIIICMVACILYGVDEGSGTSPNSMNTLCVLRPWLFDMGFNIFFLPMFSKVYRVNRIFNQVVNVVIISDIELLSPVLVFCVIDFFILVVWTTVDPLTRETIVTGTPNENFQNMTITTTTFGVCKSQYDSVFYLILVLLKGIPSIYGALMAFQTRKVFIKAMRDSIQIGAILILVVIIAAFEVAISFVIRNPTAEFALLSCGVLVIAGSTLSFVWGGKYYAIYTKQEDKWTSDPYKGKEGSSRGEGSYISTDKGTKLGTLDTRDVSGVSTSGKNSSAKNSRQEKFLSNSVEMERVSSQESVGEGS